MEQPALEIRPTFPSLDEDNMFMTLFTVRCNGVRGHVIGNIQSKIDDKMEAQSSLPLRERLTYRQLINEYVREHPDLPQCCKVNLQRLVQKIQHQIILTDDADTEFKSRQDLDIAQPTRVLVHDHGEYGTWRQKPGMAGLRSRLAPAQVDELDEPVDEPVFDSDLEQDFPEEY